MERIKAIIKGLKDGSITMAQLIAMAEIARDENDSKERHIILAAAERAGENFFQAARRAMD